MLYSLAFCYIIANDILDQTLLFVTTLKSKIYIKSFKLPQIWIHPVSHSCTVPWSFDSNLNTEGQLCRWMSTWICNVAISSSSEMWWWVSYLRNPDWVLMLQSSPHVNHKKTFSLVNSKLWLVYKPEEKGKNQTAAGKLETRLKSLLCIQNSQEKLWSGRWWTEVHGLCRYIQLQHFSNYLMKHNQ